MPSPDLTVADKDTSKSCIFAFPDRPIDSLPPDYPPGIPPDIYPYDPVDDWPPFPPTYPGDDPEPGVDPIPGSNPHPYSIEFVGFNSFLAYTSRDSFAVESRNLFDSLGFPSNIDLGWDVGGIAIGLIQAVNEYTPRDLLDSILMAENGHSTLEANTFCGMVHLQQVFPDGSIVSYFAYYAMWWDLTLGHQLWSFAPLAINGGVSNPPSLIFDNAAPLVVSPANFAFWASHSNLGLPAGTSPTTKTINTAKIFRQNESSIFTVDIG